MALQLVLISSGLTSLAFGLPPPIAITGLRCALSCLYMCTDTKLHAIILQLVVCGYDGVVWLGVLVRLRHEVPRREDDSERSGEEVKEYGSTLRDFSQTPVSLAFDAF